MKMDFFGKKQESNDGTQESEQVFRELEVKRKPDEVYVQASWFHDMEKYGIHAAITYKISENSLRLNVMTTGGMIDYYDQDNDGLVEAVVINFKVSYRNKDDEDSFLKADRNLAAYKKILNFDEILPKELEKPDPTLGDLLNDI